MSDWGGEPVGPGADLMFAIRLAADLVAAITAASSPEEERAVFDRLVALSLDQLRLTTLGLLKLAVYCVDPDKFASYMLEAEMSLPPPAEQTTADDIDPGDMIRVVTDDGTHDAIVESVSRHGQDVTITPEGYLPLTVPLNASVYVLARADHLRR